MGQYTGEGLWGDIDFPNPVGWAGHENIGTIVASRCSDWEEGTLVLAQPHGYYGFAEYIVSRPPAIARLPQDAPDPAALVVAQPLATVLRALTRTDDVIGKSCAVVGQGPMGLIFTHILRLMGASMVIATDVLDWRLEWSKRYGADHIIDASKKDVVKVVKELTNDEMIDFVVEAVGYVDSLCRSSPGITSSVRIFRSTPVSARSAVRSSKQRWIWSSMIGPRPLLRWSRRECPGTRHPRPLRCMPNAQKTP
jgi:threonine dehydrogenase-like Zn-dependent dehydrogenase